MKARGRVVEWVGGRLPGAADAAGGEPSGAFQGTVWLDLQRHQIVARVPDGPEGPEDFGATLEAAMESAVSGPPRRPQRVRVATADLAESVRRAVGEEIEIVVAATPEIDKLAQALDDSDDEGPAFRPDSYLQGTGLSEPLVARLFRACRALYVLAPWKSIDDLNGIRVEIPRLGIEGACLVVLGKDNPRPGLLLFPSREAFEIATFDTVGEQLDGVSLLALEYEREARISESLRNEVGEHAWPIADPDAYPIACFYGSGEAPRAPSELEVTVLVACAESVASFVLRNEPVFADRRAPPVSESYSGDDDLTIRLTFPYGAFDRFEGPEPAFDDEPTPRKAAPQVGRNEPCPCGSGKKYKKCHLPLDEANAAEAQRRPSVHDMDRRLVTELERFAAQRFGAAWERAFETFEDVEAELQLARPWSVYCATVEGRPIVDWYLAHRGYTLSVEERRWLEAQRAAWLSLWEITDLEPGKALQLRDLLSGETRLVEEVGASRVVRRHEVILARVVDHGSVSLLCGTHPNPLPPVAADDVVQRVRAKLRRKTPPPPERLRDEALGQFLIKRWEEAVENLTVRANTPPQLTNSDGDKLLTVKDFFSFAPGTREAIEQALQAMVDVARPDKPGAPYVVFRSEGRGSARPGRTVVGMATLSDTELEVETNSLARADALRARLEVACGQALVHERRDIANPLAPRLVKGEERGGASSAPAAADLPAVHDAVRAFKAQHYATWPDEPVPALQGKTPREATRTPEGRAAVDVLLRQMEHDESAAPESARYDFGALRRELGLGA